MNILDSWRSDQVHDVYRVSGGGEEVSSAGFCAHFPKSRFSLRYEAPNQSGLFVRPFDSSVVVREYVGIGQEFEDLISGFVVWGVWCMLFGWDRCPYDRHMGFDSVNSSKLFI